MTIDRDRLAVVAGELPEVAGVLGLSPDQLAQQVGTIEPNRAVTVERTCLLAGGPVRHSSRYARMSRSNR